MGMDAGDMIVGSVPGCAGTAPSAAKPAASPGQQDDGPSFGQVLSMLNPLQYVPVVGMIYRAVTGDTIPEPVRVAGGLAFSALTSGPIGVVLSAATEVAERALGIDPDRIGHSVLASIGLAGPEGGAKGAPANQSDPAASGSAIAAAPPTPPATPPTLAADAPDAAAIAQRNRAYAWTAAETVIGTA
jgi:hypothetical protein